VKSYGNIAEAIFGISAQELSETMEKSLNPSNHPIIKETMNKTFIFGVKKKSEEKGIFFALDRVYCSKDQKRLTDWIAKKQEKRKMNAEFNSYFE